jgi:TRAP-type mannitol/chloroaromatic compound transport system substrate-binding protein
MRRLILATTAALALMMGALSQHAAAMTAATPSEIAPATEIADVVQKTAVVCGHNGCRHYWPRRHYWGKAPVVDYPPACAPNYHYACQRGPLGYGQCACWPY